MSGPKVVRIVTREEIIEICQRLLAQLDCAISQWHKKRLQLGGDIDTDVANVTKRRQNLQNLLDEDNFKQLQKAIPIELSALQINISDLQERVIEQRAQQKQQQRQLKQNAALLLQQLNNKKITDADRVIQQLTALAQGDQLATAQNVLQNAFQLLHQHNMASSVAISAEQQQILDKMSNETTPHSFSQWRIENSLRYQDPAIQKLDHYLSELELIAPTIIEQYTLRLANIDKQHDENQRKLLLDSLNLDLAQCIRQINQRQKLQDRLQQLLVQLKAQSFNLAEFEQLLSLDDSKLAELEALIIQCEQKIAQHSREITATLRRQVMLDGLTKLGYEVREGMATLWQKEGKVVINNPKAPGYGIEVGGPPDAERWQIRPVRLTQIEDRQRDIDVETLWCSDFTKLQQWLAKQQSALLIEHSTPIGQTVVKHVMLDTQISSGINRQKQQHF